MLNKDICKRCKDKYAYVLEAVKSNIKMECKWDYIDDIKWKANSVSCPCKGWLTIPNDTIPDRCYYKLEQIVSTQDLTNAK